MENFELKKQEELQNYFDALLGIYNNTITKNLINDLEYCFNHPVYRFDKPYITGFLHKVKVDKKLISYFNTTEILTNDEFLHSDLSFHLEENQFISDITHELLPYLNTDLKLKANTGLGKSKFLMNLMIDKTLEKVVYIGSNNSFIEQLKLEHSKLAITNNSTIPSIFTGKRKTTISTDNIIYTNFAMAKQIEKLLGERISEFTVIFDESHTHVSNSSEKFQGKYLRDWFKLYPKFRNHIQITATDLYNNIQQLKPKITIEITKDEITNKNSSLISSINNFHDIVGIIENCNENGEHFKLALNDVSKILKKYKTALKLKGVKNVAIINSLTKDNADIAEITNSGDMSKISGCIATSCYQNGNSITNHSDVVHNIIVGEHHPSAIAQSISRFRNAKTINTYIMHNGEYKNTQTGITNNYIINKVNAKANSFLKMCFDNERLFNIDSIEAKKAYIKDFNRLIMLDDDGNFIIDEVERALKIYEEQTYYFNHNKEYALNVMKNDYNHNVCESTTQQVIQNMKKSIVDDKEVLMTEEEQRQKIDELCKQIDEEYRLEKKQQFVDFLEEMEQKNNKDILNMIHDEMDFDTPKWKMNYLFQLEEIMDIKKFDIDSLALETVKIRRSIGSSDIAFKRWTRGQFNIKFRGKAILHDDSPEMKAIKTIFKTFKYVNEISIKDLNKKMNELMGPLLNKNLEKYPLTNYQTTGYIKEFFHVEYKGDNKSRLKLTPLK